MTLFNVLDLETTGLTPAEGEVVEVAVCRMVHSEGKFGIADPVSELFAPANGISPETRAVHHISMGEVSGRPSCGPADLRRIALNRIPFGPVGLDDVPILVAHNADFERQWFTREVVDRPWLCTYKCALRVWPEAPRHQNSVLRYWLEDQGRIPVLGDDAQPAHRAGPDTLVTAYILREILTEATLDQCLAWTLEPRLMPKVNFGKHKGTKWSDLPGDYLDWLIRKSDMDSDTKWNAEREMKRRCESRKAAFAR